MRLQPADPESRPAETALARALEHATGYTLLLLDAAGCIASWSGSAERLTQYPAVEILGHHFSRLCAPEQMTECRDEGPVRTGADSGGRRQGWCVRRDGSRFWSDLTLTVVGEQTAVLMRDATTDRLVLDQAREAAVALEARARQDAADREALDRELAAFSHSISHDLRAPVRAIDGFGKALLAYEDKLDERGRHYLGRVIENAHRMGEIIEAVRQLSRVARADLRWEELDLTEMALAQVTQLRSKHPERTIEVGIAPGMVARGDPRLVSIALAQILDNAWKFTRPRPAAHVLIERQGEGSGAVFSVRDDGVGFDMACAGKLFGAFQRLHSGPEFEGLGVGLAIVHRIVGRHGGRIWAEGAVDQGAAFHFTLGSD